MTEVSQMTITQMISDLANRSGLNLTKIDDVKFVCEFNFENDRSHKTIILVQEDEGYGQMILVSAVVTMSAFDLSPKLEMQLLEYGRTAPIGNFARVNIGDGEILMFQQALPLFELTPDIFLSVAQTIARTADQFELEITGKDEL